MNCEWKKIKPGLFACQRAGCSNRIRAEDCERCYAKCKAYPDEPSRNPLDCRHLLAFTGNNAPLAKCGGCQTATGETGIWQCELHGLVTPLAKSTDATLRHCGGCRDWAGSQNSQDNQGQLAPLGAIPPGR
jgi:hypothetical protein